MPISKVLRAWVERYFYDEETVLFALLLATLFGVVIFFGSMLAPFLIALVIAFLLQGLVALLQRLRMPLLASVLLTFAIFLGLSAGILIWLLPLVWEQLTSLIKELPGMLRMLQTWFVELQQAYPQILSEQYVSNMLAEVTRELRSAGQLVVGYSMSSIPSVVAWLVYFILVPILVFFMLKDRPRLTGFVTSLLPRKRALLEKIWVEMDAQIANYIRGKVIEILIVGFVSWVSFAFLGLRYAELLGLMVGLSVVVPYVGAAVVTIPVVLVGLFQFGWSSHFGWVVVVYLVIQALDGNVLVPLLFSEAVNLHPVSIILAVLFFGGLWGFWGVFLAIPLATLFKAVFMSWPRAPGNGGEDTAVPADSAG